ncbi:hypothetical protein P3X46_011023 [Hevea brasiliensis]|uniref:Leucine-rich repeat-containing N-terminal plant-type domain-containing protein n=1 Tax=Hevea brasiliensis TaxID=3981 RepID=A0ABQ9MIK6_HEVBR|nr:hypothetical protein P3X46_011023 [Hevea brasiliensis]
MGTSVSYLEMLLVLLFMESLMLGYTRADAGASCIKSEKDALLNFKKRLIDPSNRLMSWVGEDCCSWKGVFCSNRTGHVIKLDLRNTVLEADTDFSLGGEINRSLLDLTNLYYLDLSMNEFWDTKIPDFLGSLKMLKYLNLSSAAFVGNIPHHLGNLSTLEYLDLSHNGLLVDSLHFVTTLSSLKHLDLSWLDLSKAGNWLQSINMLPSLLELHLSSCELDFIPQFLKVNFTSLAVLDFNQNYFGSTFPRWIFNISNNIRHLALSDNGFQGSLPREMGNCNLLEFLDLSCNALEGKIPETLSNLCNLHDFNLELNKFSGNIYGPFDNASGCIARSLKNLNLQHNSFRCTLPDNWEKFKYLEYLDLSFNSFWGPFPASIGRLSSLKELYLEYNYLNGSIPETIGQLKQLQFLKISNNSLNGNVPNSLGELSNLEFLEMSKNSLDGIISELHFSKLSGLVKFFMDGNSLVFDVDPTWVPPFQLLEISLSSCKLGPMFPLWLKTQKNLEFLYLSNTSISDTIPDWFESISGNLLSLDLSNNAITGQLPRLAKLRTSSNDLPGSGSRSIHLSSNKFEGPLTYIPDVAALDISNNFLSGHIPRITGNMMSQMKTFILSNNHLNGSIPASVCEMDSLVLLDLSDNRLSGRLPHCWHKLKDLLELDVSNNSLSGHIPISLAFLTRLSSLHLGHNNLQGMIPASLKKLTRLLTLDLSGNAFVGVIPPWVGAKLSSLRILDIHSNMFSGEIPMQLCRLASLRILNLANNKMNGTIPACFANFTTMIARKGESEDNRVLDPDDTLWEHYEHVSAIVKGIELEYTSTVPFLFSIDLSDNDFSGEIPMQLASLTKVQNLNLSGNNLKGHIPLEIGNLKSLESLDLSRNELSGSIPPSISDLNFLSYLNLSLNHLSGRIPEGNQLQTLDDKSIYIGNDGLCGSPLRSCEEEQPQRPEHVEKKAVKKSEMLWFYCGLGVGFMAGFVGVCSTLYFKDSWRHAYFRLIENIYNKLWVIVVISKNQLQRKLRGDEHGGQM